MNVFALVREYLERMLPTDGSMKVLLLDPDTLAVVSVAYTQSLLLERGVFLVDQVKATGRGRLPAMRCVVFVRPTVESIKAVAAELKAKRYSGYTLCFSNAVSTDSLNQLAGADEGELVHRVEECFADFVAINSDLMVCPAPKAGPATAEAAQLRTVHGITAACLALRRKPLIRFQASSDRAKALAAALQHSMKCEPELFDYKARETVILLTDRADDPVTPLLTPWTYQAMLHEHVGLVDNRLSLPGQKEEESYVFCQTDDRFYAANIFSNWGDLCINVKAYVDQYKATMNIDRSTATVEELKELVNKLPQAKQLTGAVTKHASVVNHLSEVIKKRHLLDISLLEQNMLADSAASDHWARLQALHANKDIDRTDIARLALIYNLRYEKTAKGSKAEALLTDTPHFMLVRRLREFYGDRNPETIFGGGMMKAVIGMIKGFKEEQNIYTQHEPLLKKQLIALSQGKMDEAAMPYQPGQGAVTPGWRPKDIIVFTVGGVTFEEAALVSQINADPGVVGDIRVLLGSTEVLNTKAFLSVLDPQ